MGVLFLVEVLGSGLDCWEGIVFPAFLPIVNEKKGNGCNHIF